MRPPRSDRSAGVATVCRPTACPACSRRSRTCRDASMPAITSTRSPRRNAFAATSQTRPMKNTGSSAAAGSGIIETRRNTSSAPAPLIEKNDQPSVWSTTSARVAVRLQRGLEVVFSSSPGPGRADEHDLVRGDAADGGRPSAWRGGRSPRAARSTRTFAASWTVKRSGTELLPLRVVEGVAGEHAAGAPPTTMRVPAAAWARCTQARPIGWPSAGESHADVTRPASLPSMVTVEPSGGHAVPAGIVHGTSSSRSSRFWPRSSAALPTKSGLSSLTAHCMPIFHGVVSKSVSCDDDDVALLEPQQALRHRGRRGGCPTPCRPRGWRSRGGRTAIAGKCSSYASSPTKPSRIARHGHAGDGDLPVPDVREALLVERVRATASAAARGRAGPATLSAPSDAVWLTT